MKRLLKRIVVSVAAAVPAATVFAAAADYVLSVGAET